jgi:hypothetical protein
MGYIYDVDDGGVYHLRTHPGRGLVCAKEPGRNAGIRVNRRIRRQAIRTLASRIRRFYPESKYGRTKVLTTVIQAGLMGPQQLMQLTRLDEKELALAYSIWAPMGGGRL